MIPESIVFGRRFYDWPAYMYPAYANWGLGLLLILFVGHALADYPLQGDFLAAAKNRWKPVAGVPWFQAMVAHSLIHAGFVYLATGCLALGLAEFFFHFTIDCLKCGGKISYTTDQVLHYALKVVYWVAFA